MSNINALVGLLQREDPAALARLREQYAQHADLLVPGKVLGDVPLSPTEQEALLRGQVCKLGLETVLVKCEDLLPRTKKRLKRLAGIQLGSQLIVGVSGGTLLVQSSEAHPWLVVPVGVLALIGSSLGIIVQHRSGVLGNNAQSAFGLYDRLLDCRLAAEHQLSELRIVLDLFDASRTAELMAIVTEGNRIALEIRQIMDKL